MRAPPHPQRARRLAKSSSRPHLVKRDICNRHSDKTWRPRPDTQRLTSPNQNSHSETFKRKLRETVRRHKSLGSHRHICVCVQISGPGTPVLPSRRSQGLHLCGGQQTFRQTVQQAPRQSRHHYERPTAGARDLPQRRLHQPRPRLGRSERRRRGVGDGGEGPTAGARDSPRATAAWASHKSADGCVLVCLPLCSSALRRLYRTPASADPIGDTEARIGRFARRKEATRTDTNNKNRGGVGGGLGQSTALEKVCEGREGEEIGGTSAETWGMATIGHEMLTAVCSGHEAKRRHTPFSLYLATRIQVGLHFAPVVRLVAHATKPARQDQQSRTAKPGSHVCSIKVCLAQGVLQEPPQTSEVYLEFVLPRLPEMFLKQAPPLHAEQVDRSLLCCFLRATHSIVVWDTPKKGRLLVTLLDLCVPRPRPRSTGAAPPRRGRRRRAE